MKKYSKYLYKKPEEINKRVWEIRKKDGTIIDSCRTKLAAIKEKNKLEKEYFEDLELIRI